MNRITKKFVFLCLAGTVLASNPSFADTEEYVLTYSYADLQSDSGRKLVLQRIVSAAKRYCPSYSRVRSLDAVRTCVDGVVEDLVAKVSSSEFTAYVEGERNEGWSVAGVEP